MGVSLLAADGTLNVAGGDAQSDNDDPAESCGLYASRLIVESGMVTASGGKAASRRSGAKQ